MVLGLPDINQNMLDMENSGKKLKIAVLEDSSFYNKIICKKLDYYTKLLSDAKGFKYEIESYAHFDDFLRNLKADINIVFLDYYLGEGVTAIDVMDVIQKKCANCKIVIISQSSNPFTAEKTLSNGAAAFIYKDKDALEKSCYFVEEFTNVNFS